MGPYHPCTHRCALSHLETCLLLSSNMSLKVVSFASQSLKHLLYVASFKSAAPVDSAHVQGQWETTLVDRCDIQSEASGLVGTSSGQQLAAIWTFFSVT